MRADAGTVAMLLLSVAALGCADGGVSPLEPNTPARTPPPDPPGIVAPREFFSGVFLGDAATTPERVDGAIAEYGVMVGKRPALVKTFHNLNADLAVNGWAGRVVHAIARTGATNYLALDLDWSGRSGSLLDALNNGGADALLARAAQSIAAIPGKVLVEPAWEMNGNWNYGWQGVLNGGDASAPARYRSAWRRVVEIFRANGASNVRWVFNPNTGNALAGPGAGSAHWNWYANYYPGDAYVDYVGAHGYNGAATWSTPYRHFEQIFYGPDGDHVLDDMARRFPDKPIIIGELASEETPGQDKGAWVRAAYTRMRNDPRVVGAVWFNMKKEADWRIDSSAGSQVAYREAMSHDLVRAAYNDAVIASRAVMLASR